VLHARRGSGFDQEPMDGRIAFSERRDKLRRDRASSTVL